MTQQHHRTHKPPRAPPQWIEVRRRGLVHLANGVSARAAQPEEGAATTDTQSSTDAGAASNADRTTKRARASPRQYSRPDGHRVVRTCRCPSLGVRCRSPLPQRRCTQLRRTARACMHTRSVQPMPVVGAAAPIRGRAHQRDETRAHAPATTTIFLSPSVKRNSVESLIAVPHLLP